MFFSFFAFFTGNLVVSPTSAKDFRMMYIHGAKGKGAKKSCILRIEMIPPPITERAISFGASTNVDRCSIWAIIEETSPGRAQPGRKNEKDHQ
ncbi:MAG: hypothetical protein PUF17_08105 [Lactimicrobium massiliense]|nr:hypothetical protein [Lactimicrobium massiliense]MDD6560918.1 hypothetical protein [Lactimicrobium massiliense]